MTMVYVAETEEAMLQGKKIRGELWFMGGGEIWDDMGWAKIHEWPTEMSGLKWQQVVTREIKGEIGNEKNIVVQEMERAMGLKWGKCRLGYETSEEMSVKNVLRPPQTLQFP